MKLEVRELVVHIMSAEAQSKLQEQAAYHEAGHMVAAADQGIVFDPRGLRIDSAGKGIAFYCKDAGGTDCDAFRERLIVAAWGGYVSNKHFGHVMPDFASYEDDYPEVGRLLREMSADRSVQMLGRQLQQRAEEIIGQNSAAVSALANALLAKEWEPREILNLKEDWSRRLEEKRMGGEEAASLLRAHGLPNAMSRG